MRAVACRRSTSACTCRTCLEAAADRVADRHAEAPRRVIGPERLPERAAETGVDASRSRRRETRRCAAAACRPGRCRDTTPRGARRAAADSRRTRRSSPRCCTALRARATSERSVDRLRHGRVDVGQRRAGPAARRLVRDARCQNDGSAGSMISRRSRSSRVVGGGARANQVLAAVGHLGFGLHEIDRRRLAEPRRARRSRFASCSASSQRALLHGRRSRAAPSTSSTPASRPRRCRRPSRGTAAPSSPRCASRSGTAARAASIFAVADQRLRERDLESRLQARIEAVERTVAGRPRRVPRDAPRAVAPRHALADAGRREPVARVDAAVPEQRVGRRRHVARSPEASSRTPACTRCGSRRPAPPGPRCRAARRRGPDCGRRRAAPPRRASAPAPEPELRAAGSMVRRASRHRPIASAQRRRATVVVVLIMMPPPVREP